MPLSDATQLGRISAQVEGLRDDLREVREERGHDEKRLRDVEKSVSLMVESQRDQRRREETQYRRIEVRLQVLTIIAAIAGVASPIALVLFHR